MSALTNFVFDAGEGQVLAVRTVMEQEVPWFVASDVCGILGYRNASDAIGKHCKGVAKRYPLATAGGTQEVRVLSEADVLRLIVNSRLPAAERFERWVFEEVLPAIRRTGGYTSPGAAVGSFSPAAAQFLSHGADIQVAADRTFRAVVRSARVAGLGLPAALRRANTVTLTRTGIDMLAELHAEDHVSALEEEQGVRVVLPVAANVVRFWGELERGDFQGLGNIPALTTQWHRLYGLWCAARGEHPCPLPHMSNALSKLGLRAVRKRWGHDRPKGPNGFLWPRGAAVPPGRAEVEWLTECVGRADLRLSGSPCEATER